MACVVIRREKLNALKAIGVRDSKSLTPRARAKRVGLIEAVSEAVLVRVVEPEEIDAAVLGITAANLNDLEARVAAELLEEVRPRPSVVYVDSRDPIPERYSAKILSLLSYEATLIADSHAENKYPVVAAASIVAKVVRDRLVEELKASYGDFGSGYPSDPRTREFLRRWVEEKGELPPIVRKSWKTVRNLEGEVGG